MKESSALRLITILSILIPAAVAFLFYMPGKTPDVNPGLFQLPLFHAILNGTTFVLLGIGYVLILNKKIPQHRATMIAAAALSAVFLISYVTYHSLVPQSKFLGQGFIRPLYFSILLSHILLAVVIVPLVLLTLYRGLTANYPKHKKIARWTLPLWMYVAITGVIVYLMMKPYYPGG